MAEDNEVAFDTADVKAMQDNDPALKSESDVVSFVQGRFKRAEDVRQQDEQRWLKAYRNYRGLYGPDVQFTSTEKSRVFVKVTKTKVLAAYGQIVDVLFGSHKFPISINPTKLPDGVAEAVHFETNPQIKEATSQGLTPDDTKLQPGETIIDLRERLGGLRNKLAPVLDDLREGEGQTPSQPSSIAILASDA